MRNYLDINLDTQSVQATELHGEDILKAGRYFIAKTLLEQDKAAVDPLSADNPLIFSAGPLAGTTFSNANRTSVGCKSPLTGGIKEANGGGTFSYGLGQLNYAGLTLHGRADDWTIIHLTKDGKVNFDDAKPFLAKGNMETAEMLYQHYGKRVSLALLGPVGEYEGLIAGISFSDSDGRPVRIAARGGVGAVMGHKRVKAIVVDLDRIPTLHDPKKSKEHLRDYAKMLQDNPLVKNFYGPIGTMGMADYQNRAGGLPVRNFSAGQLVDTDQGEVFKMGGDYISDLNTSRGGKQTHACMPGCVIRCSNVYVDEDGNEVVSPVEYETLGLLGTNCGISDPDDLAALNYIANDLGVDSIEVGAMLAVLMEAGEADFGDVDWMAKTLRELYEGTDKAKIWAQGTARVGEHYNVARVPVIKKQAISAYDPRVIEGTGISMMTTAQGADHTTGNIPRLESKQHSAEELIAMSIDKQIGSAFNDSLGLCIFGGSVTNSNLDFIAETLNDAHGTTIDSSFFETLGRETLKLERAFNRKAGFSEADDELPQFFYDEPIAPTDYTARFHAKDVQDLYNKL